MGSKVTKVAEKVATDTAEDLRKAAGSFEGAIPGEHTHTHTHTLSLSLSLSLSLKRLYGVFYCSRSGVAERTRTASQTTYSSH